MLLLEQVNILFQFVTGPKLFPWQSLHLTMSKQLSELLQHSMDKTYMLDAVLWRLTIQRYQLISASLIFFSDPQISSNNIPNAINILNLNNILMSLQYNQMQGVGWLILISIHKANVYLLGCKLALQIIPITFCKNKWFCLLYLETYM